MGFLLSIIAYALFIPMVLINFVIVMFTHIKKHGFFKVTNDFWFTNAYELDVYSNYAFRTSWNVLFKTKEGYRFGVRGETISSALGKNQRDKTLTWIGWLIVGILYAIDYKFWGEGGHCLNSIMEFETT